jgi:succinate dehydrogenase/fumarate reductase cytochrome b subunit
LISPKRTYFIDNIQHNRLEMKFMEKLLIIAFIILIIWNLGAGLYYMMVDKGKSNRTVNSLSWRIGLSVLLIALLFLGIITGVVKPHGI